MCHIVYFLQPIISSWSFQTISRKRFLRHQLQEKKSDLNVLHLDSKFYLKINRFTGEDNFYFKDGGISWRRTHINKSN